jgi:hypothetical protein
MAPSKQVTPDEARRNAQTVRQFWQGGQASLRRLRRLRNQDPDAFAHGGREQTHAAEARGLGVNADKAAKMRRAAREYTRGQMEEVCALVGRHRARFAATQLLVLLRVADRARRDALMRRSVRQGWTTSHLERAVQAARGARRPHVGRRPRVPADPAERLLALGALAGKWCRWCDAALADLPGDVKAPIDLAVKAVRRVQRAVGEELHKLGGTRRTPRP